MIPNSVNRKGWHWIVVSLVFIGIVVQLIESPLTLIIPVVIIGIVYYLYKKPPYWLQRLAFSRNTKIPFHVQTKQHQAPKKRKYRFRVIDGKKKSI